MKSLKCTILCVLTVAMLAAFCGCRMEDGKVQNSASIAPSATADMNTAAPRQTTMPNATNAPRATDNNGNIGEDIGQGIENIGDDIKDASGAAKQVNG